MFYCFSTIIISDLLRYILAVNTVTNPIFSLNPLQSPFNPPPNIFSSHCKYTYTLTYFCISVFLRFLSFCLYPCSMLDTTSYIHVSDRDLQTTIDGNFSTYDSGLTIYFGTPRFDGTKWNVLPYIDTFTYNRMKTYLQEWGPGKPYLSTDLLLDPYLGTSNASLHHINIAYDGKEMSMRVEKHHILQAMSSNFPFLYYMGLNTVINDGNELPSSNEELKKAYPSIRVEYIHNLTIYALSSTYEIAIGESMGDEKVYIMYLMVKQATPYREIYMKLLNLLGVYWDTDMIYTMTLRGSIMRYINILINGYGLDHSSEHLYEPFETIDIRSLRPSRYLTYHDIIHWGPQEKYVAMHWPKGERKWLLFHASGIWFVDPYHSTLNWISNASDYTVEGSLYDGHLIPYEQRNPHAPVITQPSLRYWFIAHDCLAFPEKYANVPTRNQWPLLLSYRTRLFGCQIIADAFKDIPLYVSTPLVYSTEALNLFLVQKKLLDLEYSCPYPTRGILYYPSRPGNDPVLKWAHHGQVSVDLRVVRVLSSQNVLKSSFELYVYDPDDTNTPYKPYPYMPVWKGSLEALDTLEKFPSPAIVEFVMSSSGDMLPMRLRPDRWQPNTLKQVQELWKCRKYTLGNNLMYGGSEELFEWYQEEVIKKYIRAIRDIVEHREHKIPKIVLKVSQGHPMPSSPPEEYILVLKEPLPTQNVLQEYVERYPPLGIVFVMLDGDALDYIFRPYVNGPPVESIEGGLWKIDKDTPRSYSGLRDFLSAFPEGYVLAEYTHLEDTVPLPISCRGKGAIYIAGYLKLGSLEKNPL